MKILLGFLLSLVFFTSVSFAGLPTIPNSTYQGIPMTIQVEKANYRLFLDSIYQELPEDIMIFKYKDRAYGPLRFIAEGLNKEVVYSQEFNSINIAPKDLGLNHKQVHQIIMRKLSLPVEDSSYSTLLGAGSAAGWWQGEVVKSKPSSYLPGWFEQEKSFGMYLYDPYQDELWKKVE